MNLDELLSNYLKNQELNEKDMVKEIFIKYNYYEKNNYQI